MIWQRLLAPVGPPLVSSLESRPALISSSAVPLWQPGLPFERFINGVAVLLLIGLIGLCLIAMMAVLAALLPKAKAHSKAAVLRSPWRSFLIGLANYLFLGGISLVLLDTEVPPLALVGVIIAAFLIAVTFIGLVGLVSLIGERLATLRTRDMSALAQLIWGTLAVELAGLLPFVGWFLLTPVLLMISFGAAVLAWRNRKQKEVWE